MELAKEDYYKALMSHDSRFDGLFFNCVKSTGIYCRPICPTHVPKIENCTFVTSAAEAEKNGYRPCLRCRPELAPAIRETEDTVVHRLSKHIEESLLIDETLSEVVKVYELSERQLRRLFVETYGVDPKQYLTTRRLLFAKQLLQDTDLPIRDVAYSAGFNTPSRLTINMRQAYGFTPERFRKDKAPKRKTGYMTLRADYRPPFNWNALLQMLQARATPLEWVDTNKESYSRSVNGRTIIVTNMPSKNHLTIQLPIELSRQAHTIIRKVRFLFDLDASPLTIQNALSADPLLEKLITEYPGLRVPGCWEGFELLLRVIVGQQISVAGATTLMGRLVDRIGVTPDAVAESTPGIIAAIGMPAKRAATIWEVAKMVQAGTIKLDEHNPERFYEQLIAVPGIGPWTVEYLRMRILHWPDAFPTGDLGLQKALLPGQRIAEKELYERANAWRPWRSYAAMLLWKSLANKGG